MFNQASSICTMNAAPTVTSCKCKATKLVTSQITKLKAKTVSEWVGRV